MSFACVVFFCFHLREKKYVPLLTLIYAELNFYSCLSSLRSSALSAGE